MTRRTGLGRSLRTEQSFWRGCWHLRVAGAPWYARSVDRGFSPSIFRRRLMRGYERMPAHVSFHRQTFAPGDRQRLRDRGGGDRKDAGGPPGSGGRLSSRRTGELCAATWTSSCVTCSRTSAVRVLTQRTCWGVVRRSSFSLGASPGAGPRAADGVAGYLSKGLSAVELVEALEAIHCGEPVPSPDVEDHAVGAGDWPGREAGLTPREAEILALIVRGLSNQESRRPCS